MMKKRIGNDISFVWHIYRKSGDTQVPESFTGKDVTIKLISPLQRTVTIEDVSIATGVVTFTFRGKHQVTLGNYAAVLLENKGEDGMVTLDVVSAVTLVPHSYMEEDGDEGDVIEAESVELTSTISAGGGGGIEQQQADWAQTDDTAVDYIKNKPDLDLYCRKDADNTHSDGVSDTFAKLVYNEHSVLMQADRLTVGGDSIKFYHSHRGEEIKELSLHIDDVEKLKDLPTATELTQELESKADVGRVEDIEDALSVVESETADATDYTTETTSVSTDNITINPVAVRRSTIYSVYKQGGGQENIEGVFSPGYTNGSYILNVQIAQAGTVKINSIRTRYYSGYYPIVYFYFTPTGGEKVKVAEIAKASSGTPIGYKYEEPTVSINASGAGVLSIELWLYDIDTYNTIPAFFWMEHERSSVVYYAITSISFEQSSLTGFVNDGSYNSTTKKIELKHDSDILAEIDATDIFDSDNYYDKDDVDGLLADKVDKIEGKGLSTNDYTDSDKGKLSALPTNSELATLLSGKADTADLAPVATSGSYNDLTNKPTIPAAQVQSDWNESDTTSKAYIKNKPTIPTVPINVSAFNNDAGYITASDVANKQDKMPIVQVASGTTAIIAAVNTYYEVAGEVGALAITLPTPTDLTKVSMVVVHLTAGTTPNIVIGSTETIDYSAAYDISAGKEYEINCLFNGGKWVVADMEVA